eukprot:1161474-Pelagomonas_calceolata.AAC.5
MPATFLFQLYTWRQSDIKFDGAYSDLVCHTCISRLGSKLQHAYCALISTSAAAGFSPDLFVLLGCLPFHYTTRPLLNLLGDTTRHSCIHAPSKRTLRAADSKPCLFDPSMPLLLHTIRYPSSPPLGNYSASGKKAGKAPNLRPKPTFATRRHKCASAGHTIHPDHFQQRICPATLAILVAEHDTTECRGTASYSPFALFHFKQTLLACQDTWLHSQTCSLCSKTR